VEGVPDADTASEGQGSTVAKTIEGAVHPTASPGSLVTNPGSTPTGADITSIELGSGRPPGTELTAAGIARGRDDVHQRPKAVETIGTLMMGQNASEYTMPLGLHHLIGGTHYAPMPQNVVAQRSDWTAVYYHQATAEGTSDRIMKGNQAVGQHFPPVRDMSTTSPRVRRNTCSGLSLRVGLQAQVRQDAWDDQGELYYEGTTQVAAMQARQLPVRSIRSATRKSPSVWQSSRRRRSGATRSSSSSRRSANC
jgi:alpha-glucuronidase